MDSMPRELNCSKIAEADLVKLMGAENGNHAREIVYQCRFFFRNRAPFADWVARSTKSHLEIAFALKTETIIWSKQLCELAALLRTKLDATLTFKNGALYVNRVQKQKT